jgi:ribose/xylose/arabinose/galactoside ABC-type transport system permease subunit
LEDGEEKMKLSDNSGEKIKELLKSSEFRIGIAAVVIFSMFGLLNKNFFTQFIWRGILRTSADLSFLIIGETLVITSGEIDLSVASTWALSAFIFLTLVNSGVDPIFATVAVLLLGLLVGFANGLVTTRTGVPSFLVTLASLWIVRSVLFTLTFESYSYLKVATVFNNILVGYLGVFPYEFIWFIVFAAIFTVILTRTRFGSHVLAVGGNRTVARNLGVRVERTKILCFILCGVMAALGGIAFITTFGEMQPGSGMEATFGAGLEFEAIAVCMMSGMSPWGGRSSIIAVFIASVAYASFKSGLVLSGLPGYWYLPFTGIMVFLLVGLHLIGRKKVLRTA